MDIEYEAVFVNINKDDIRKKLAKAGANPVRKEFLQKRVVFNLPKGNHINGGWLRVDNFEEARKFLTGIGSGEKAYQESRRELWEMDGIGYCLIWIIRLCSLCFFCKAAINSE